MIILTIYQQLGNQIKVLSFMDRMNKTKIEKSDPTLSANTHKYGV